MLKYVLVPSTDPAYNLALEQYFFDVLPKEDSYLLLWQNDNAVIIGRHQNTLSEINEPYIQEHSIKVVRRLSGGGAVYHDLGNLNFTFITDAPEERRIDLRRFCEPVADTLHRLGVKAEINGRNDITVDGKKFSGNAQYVKNGRVMHHGTILFDSDLSVVEKALRPDPDKIKAKGVASVRSRVTNLKPYFPGNITLVQFRDELLKTIAGQTPAEPYILQEKDLEAILQLKKDVYDTRLWNYGASPEFTDRKKRRFPGCGTVEAFMVIRRGILEQIRFSGDYFSTEDPKVLETLLEKQKAQRDVYRSLLEGTDISLYFTGLDLEQFLSLLCD